MKKKHEIIKYAYENFPKGTLFRWYKGVGPFVSTGKFKFEFSDSNALFVDLTDDSTDAGVTVFDGHKWAEIVPEKKSILDGKVAIQVNNEHEFELLMGHYKSKQWCGEWIEINKYPYYIDYKNYFDSSDNKEIFDSRNEIIIPFTDFAAEVRIEVPVKIIVSEDGVDLYEGDNYHRAYAYENGVWRYDFCEKLALNHVVCNSAISSLAKTFSTKEAAEKFISEQNKPKSVQVPLFNTNLCYVSKDKIDIIDVIGGSISLKPSDLEDMLHAYKSLQ